MSAEPPLRGQLRGQSWKLLIIDVWHNFSASKFCVYKLQTMREMFACVYKGVAVPLSPVVRCFMTAIDQRIMSLRNDFVGTFNLFALLAARGRTGSRIIRRVLAATLSRCIVTSQTEVIV